MRFVHKLSQALLLVESECERERQRVNDKQIWLFFDTGPAYYTYNLLGAMCLVYYTRNRSEQQIGRFIFA